jgi:hypothetical protein
MRIRKTFQGEVPENKIVNTYSNSNTDAYSCDIVNGFVNGVKKEGCNDYLSLGDGNYDTLIASVSLAYSYSRECLILAVGQSGSSDSQQTGIAIICPSCQAVGEGISCPITCMGNLTSSMFRTEMDGNTMNIYFTKSVTYRRDFLYCLGKSSGIFLNM